MNDFQYIKEAVNIKSVAQLYGLKLNQSDMCCCPSHGEKTPSMKLYEKGNNYHCFGCGEHGDVIDLTAKLHGITTVEASKKLNQDFKLGLNIGTYRPPPEAAARLEHQRTKEHKSREDNLPEPDYTDFFRQANQNLEKTNYHRGITLDTLNRFNIGFVPQWKHPKAPNAPFTPRLIIPTSEHSYLARDTRENLSDIEKKYAKSKVGKVKIFNEQALKTAKKPVFVVEGELDALSIIDTGGEAVALGSVSNINALLKQLEKQRPSQPIVIALDNDSAGINGTKELEQGLQKLGIPHFKLNISAPYKDANEALQANRSDFAVKVQTAENLQWLKNAHTVLTTYRNILQKWENIYPPNSPMYAESQSNKKAVDSMLSLFGGNEYKVMQFRPQIEKTALRLREIMKQGLHKIRPDIIIQRNEQQRTFTENKPKTNQTMKGNRKNAR